MAIVANGREFKVHRIILESRCPKLIEQLEEVDDSSVYSLSCIEAPVLQHILSYLYTGVCICDNEFLEKVLIAADTFSLADLTSCLLRHPACVTSITKINVFQAIFTWIIDKSIQSTKESAFLLLAHNMPRWSWMKITLFRTSNDDPNPIYSLNFQRMFGNRVTFVHCEIQILDEGNKLHVLEHVFENELEWETPIDFQANSIDGMLHDGDLQLDVKIRVSVDGHYTSETKEIKFNTILPKFSTCIESSTFQKDLQNLYERMVYSDVVLCIDGEKLPAHKAILCSRSEVFSKMFLHERQADTVDIQDVDLQTMASILMYMYCGVIEGPLTVPKAIQKYASGDKYKLTVLRRKCSRFLISNVNAENVGDILILADAHQDESLKKCIFDFISSNPREILNSKIGLSVLEDKGYLYAEMVNRFLLNAIEKE